MAQLCERELLGSLLLLSHLLTDPRAFIRSRRGSLKEQMEDLRRRLRLYPRAALAPAPPTAPRTSAAEPSVLPTTAEPTTTRRASSKEEKVEEAAEEEEEVEEEEQVETKEETATDSNPPPELVPLVDGAPPLAHAHAAPGVRVEVLTWVIRVLHGCCVLAAIFFAGDALRKTLRYNVFCAAVTVAGLDYLATSVFEMRARQEGRAAIVQHELRADVAFARVRPARWCPSMCSSAERSGRAMASITICGMPGRRQRVNGRLPGSSGTRVAGQQWAAPHTCAPTSNLRHSTFGSIAFIDMSRLFYVRWSHEAHAMCFTSSGEASGGLPAPRALATLRGDALSSANAFTSSASSAGCLSVSAASASASASS